ncbi:MAG: phosphoenolpyruvate--protein phosphotransferase [Gammaproteobacteria bacterium]|nr:phosphoenolpyruvate--protein phosphotransferase [Gammaproteobacteria bacterium]
MTSTIKVIQNLIHQVDHAPDLKTALNIIVENVSRELAAEVSSVYLVQKSDKQSQLILKANIGFKPEAIDKVALDFGEGLAGQVAERSEAYNIINAQSHKDFCFVNEINEAAFHSFLGVPIIEHGRIFGVLTVQKKRGSFSDEDEAFLTTLATRLSTAILHAKNEGELQHKLEIADGTVDLEGAPGSPGISIGHALLVFDKEQINSIQNLPSRGEDFEKYNFNSALNSVISELTEQAEIMRASLPESEVALFTVYIQMLQGGPLIEETYRTIEQGSWAPYAWRTSVEAHAEIFDAMSDAYLAERAQDVRDLGKRVLKGLMGGSDTLLNYPPDTVLIGENISVTDLALIPSGVLKGIVSGHGSKSSHVAILAHALGVPAVMGVSNLPSRGLNGRTVVVDGYSGHIYIDPHPQLFESLNEAINADDLILKQLGDMIDEPATTLDGIDISLYVNSGLMADLSPAVTSGADGIGLYRTEIPFQVRERFPSEAEQYVIYHELLTKFKGKPVVLRTLDVGGDKPLSYFPIIEDNPFLGWRGIRIALDHPEIFITQVRAMLKANIGNNNLHILLPMITSRVELDDALILIHRAKNELDDEMDSEVPFPKVGVMIEVPAAVYQIEELCKLVDFVSVGTNDLTQYLLAVDRNNENVADLFSALHPAVLKALQQIVQGALKQNTPVSVCGEMAGDPMGMIMLLGLGIQSLSMSTGSIGRIKEIIRHFSTSEAFTLFNDALELADADDIRDMLIEKINEKGLGGLIRAGS